MSTPALYVSGLENKLQANPWRPRFAPASDRTAWENMKTGEAQRVWCKQIVAEAERYLGQPFPVLTARAFMAYNLAGDSGMYEQAHFERRSRLGLMVAAECIEYQGHFLDDIIEGVWAILSEVVWGVPSLERYNPGDPLPAASKSPLELFNCATGMLLAECKQLLGRELDAVSSSLLERAGAMVIDRLIEPLESMPQEFWWMNGSNNWTPWCGSNLTGCILTFLEGDPSRQTRALHTLLVANERFLANYSADGCCDEGPCYWAVSPQMLMIMLDQLDQRIGGQFKGVFADPVFRTAGEYIARVTLCGKYVLNTADSAVRSDKVSAGAIYHYGELISSELMKQYALLVVHGMKCGTRRIEPCRFMQGTMGVVLTFLLRDLFWTPAETPDAVLPLESVVLYGSAALFIGRENSSIPESGSILAIKGGHNAENHNHNDIGQFTIYRDGIPLVVDPGVGAYTRQTFSSNRYGLWFCGAAGHNVPVINGICQQAGKEYCSTVSSSALEGESIGITLDMSMAYPVAAGITKMSRDAKLNRRTGDVRICDRVESSSPALAIELPLIVTVEPESVTPQSAVIGNMTLKFDNLRIDSIEIIDCSNDASLLANWGKRLYKLLLTGTFAGNGDWELLFKAKR